MAEANKLLFFVGVIAAILVVSSLAIAQKASLSPTEVAKQTFAAVEKKDTEAFKALMCKYLRDYVEKSERKNDLLQVFMGILELTTPDKKANTSEKIEGDKAKVTFTQKNADGSPWEYSFDLTKEDDRWTGFCLEPKDLEGFQLSDKMNSRLAGAKAIENGQIRKDVEAFYARRSEAFKAKDLAAYTSMETDDYKYVIWGLVPGVLTRQKTDEDIAHSMQRAKSGSSFWTKVDSIKQGADDNEVLVESTYKAQGTDQAGKNNSPEAKYHDILVRDKGVWKIKYSELVNFF